MLFWVLHNVVAHPLLILPFKWASRFHDWTAVWAFPPIASCVLHVRHDGKVLAVARRGTLDQWGLPGGKLEQNESPLGAAARELIEETGMIALFHQEIYRGMDDLGNVVVTYVVKEVIGGLEQGDAGPVEYVPWGHLTNGPFGRYNTELQKRWNKYSK